MPDVPELAAPPARTTSLALLVAGALMLVAGLLLANPYAGATDMRWPWQILAQEGTHHRVRMNWSFWFLGALIALGFGWTRFRAWRAPVLLGFALVLTINCSAGNAGLAITQIALPWFVGLCLLMAGFLLEAQGHRRGAARALASLGGILVLWNLASSFSAATEGPTGSYLEVLIRDAFTRLGQGTVPGARPNYDIDLWSYAAVIVAAVIGLLGWFGLRGPLVGITGFLLVLVHYLVPTFDRLGHHFATGPQTQAVFFTLSEALIHTGLALGIFVAAVVADVARLESEDA
jgi:hypothetical protein